MAKNKRYLAYIEQGNGKNGEYTLKSQGNGDEIITGKDFGGLIVKLMPKLKEIKDSENIEVVIFNTNQIPDLKEDLKPFPEEEFNALKIINNLYNQSLTRPLKFQE